MRVYLLLNCVAFLQLKAEVACGTAGKEEENINPFELARQLRAEICAIYKSQIQEFYKTQRDEENRDWQFSGADKHDNNFIILAELSLIIVTM